MCVLADEVGIALLLVVQGLKVLLNLEPDDRGWCVGEEVDELVLLHVGEKSLLNEASGRATSGN